MIGQPGVLILISLLPLCGESWGAAAGQVGDPDDVAVEGQGNLRTANESVLGNREAPELGKFRRAPRFVDKKVVFVDESGNIVNERPTGYKDFGSKGKEGSSRPRKEARQKPGGQQGAGQQSSPPDIATVKYESPYPMTGGQGIFIARYKEPTTPDQLNEDSPIERTEVLDQRGNPVATIQGDYKFEAAPSMSYFVGIACTGGLTYQFGTITFFDRSGKQFAQEKAFDFGGMGRIAISGDGEHVIVTLRASGHAGKSGVAVFDRNGKLLWKKQETGWDLAGPLDSESSFGREQKSFLALGPQQTFFMFSRDGTICFSIDGRQLWTSPRRASILSAEKDWKRIAIWEARSRSVVILDPISGVELSSFKSPCEGGPYSGDNALQIQEGLVLIKTGQSEPRRELSRCFALVDEQGKLVWKKAIQRKRTIRPMADGNEDVELLAGKRILLKDGAQQTVFDVGKP